MGSVSDSYKSYLEKGFTLIEVLAVIVIIGVLSSLAVPAVGQLIEKAEADVCDVIRSEIDRLYQDHLVLDALEHSDVLFLQFLERFSDTCPIGGNYDLVDGGRLFVICIRVKRLKILMKMIVVMVGCRFCRLV